MCPVTSMATSGLRPCSHVPVAEICSFNLCILLVTDLVLVREILGSGGLCGCLVSLASTPDQLPTFAFSDFSAFSACLSCAERQGPGKQVKEVRTGVK